MKPSHWILFGALCGSVAAADSINYTYDSAGRLILAAYPGGKAISYTYDKAGNLLSRTAGSGAAPTITGVVSSADFLPGTAASSWTTILGTGLSATTRGWGGPDFVNNNLPLQLDGVSVKINGIPAYVNYISPSQLNVLAPDDNTTGPVQVQVQNAFGTSNSFTVTKSPVTPAFFLFTPKYPAAVHVSGVYVGKAGLIPGATSSPAKPGETIVMYGTGFGPSKPPLPAGKLVSQPAPLSNTVTVKIGGQAANVAFAGISASGLDQLNVTVPASLPDGDATVVATVSGANTQPNLFLTIHH